jgi:putative PIN family toxin of toxin-antitoxin system
MRVVLDTNTVISGLLWSGPSHDIIKAAIRDEIELYTTAVLIDELIDVLHRPNFQSRLQAANIAAITLIADYRSLNTIIQPVPILPTARDPDDDAVLACAVAANAEAIVSGDQDLLSLNSFQGISIYTAVSFLALLET